MNPNPSLVAGASAVLSLSSSMKPVELGSAIHNHLELHPGGEVRVESKDGGKTVTIRVTEDDLEKLSPAEPSPRPHVNVGVIGRNTFLPMAAALLASGAALGHEAFSYYPKFGSPSSKTVRNSPERVKTPEDLERIEAARAKQARKAAKRAKAGK